MTIEYTKEELEENEHMPFDGCDVHGLKVVYGDDEDNEFSGDKYQWATYIYEQKETGKFFQAELCRSGSHFTDWYYDHENEGLVLTEVRKVTKMVEVTEWETVEE